MRSHHHDAAIEIEARELEVAELATELDYSVGLTTVIDLHYQHLLIPLADSEPSQIFRVVRAAEVAELDWLLTRMDLEES